jgi:hypothetical protein
MRALKYYRITEKEFSQDYSANDWIEYKNFLYLVKTKLYIQKYPNPEYILYIIDEAIGDGKIYRQTIDGREPRDFRDGMCVVNERDGISSEHIYMRIIGLIEW